MRMLPGTDLLTPGTSRYHCANEAGEYTLSEFVITSCGLPSLSSLPHVS